MGAGAYRDGQGLARTVLAEEERRLSERAAAIRRGPLALGMPPALDREIAELEARLAGTDGGTERELKASLLARYEQAIEAALAIEAGRTECGPQRYRRWIAPGSVVALAIGLAVALFSTPGGRGKLELRWAYAGVDQPTPIEKLGEDDARIPCSTMQCKHFGRCTREPSGHCVATSDADCRISQACKTRGRCAEVDGWCIVGSHADCARSTRCKLWGYCSVGDFGECLAQTDDDCEDSEACTLQDSCRAFEGRCVD